MGRLFLAVFATAGVVAIVVPAATAVPPTRVPVVAPSDFTLSGVCAFDVNFHVVKNNETTTTFSDGSWATTGSFIDIVSNASDPTKSYYDNNSAPIFFTPHPDGTATVKVTGQGGLFFFPGQVGPEGVVWLTNGNFQETLDATGTPIASSIRYSGKPVVDLCKVLA